MKNNNNTIGTPAGSGSDSDGIEPGLTENGQFAFGGTPVGGFKFEFSGDSAAVQQAEAPMSMAPTANNNSSNSNSNSNHAVSVPLLGAAHQQGAGPVLLHQMFGTQPDTSNNRSAQASRLAVSQHMSSPAGWRPHQQANANANGVVFTAGEEMDVEEKQVRAEKGFDVVQRSRASVCSLLLFPRFYSLRNVSSFSLLYCSRFLPSKRPLPRLRSSMLLLEQRIFPPLLLPRSAARPRFPLEARHVSTVAFRRPGRLHPVEQFCSEALPLPPAPTP